MDPNETLRLWANSTGAKKREFAGYLREWLRNGGFEPKWHSARERAVFMGAAPARRNPSANDSPSFGLILLPALIVGGIYVLYQVLKPSAATGEAIVPATGGPNPPSPTSPRPVVVTVTGINPDALPPTTNLTLANHEAIRGIQARLRDLGFDPGALIPIGGGLSAESGDWNHDTSYAIAYFQRREGLPANGVFNGATAIKLASVYERKIQQQAASVSAAELRISIERLFWRDYILNGFFV